MLYVNKLYFLLTWTVSFHKSTTFRMDIDCYIREIHALHKLNALLIFVIAWVAVKFGINTTSVVLKMGQISRDEAE